ncbi:hypothetical protein UPYG_G00246690 [Umbra pygmaea]|uniref:Uncharacterized protein n=1 Tax=Umbra pygmaea TaxID=75934 RepID=A0ABD0WGG1_UMBPY
MEDHGMRAEVWGSISQLVICLVLAQLTPANMVQVVGQTEPVIALVGDDVILPCSLNPMTSAKDQSVNWLRPDMNLKDVHYYRDGRDSNDDQNPSYSGRTSLFKEELNNGNISLKLTIIKLTDAGNYSCYVPSLDRDQKATIELTVGAVSQPVISVLGPKDDGVVLKCESGGWYPEPKMTWLDSDGSILPDGPTETQTDSEGRYTLRGEVTVKKTENNRFTCRVNQQQINKIKEILIDVPDEAFAKSHGGLITDEAFAKSRGGLIAGVFIAVLVAVVAAGVGVFMWRKKKETKKVLEEKEVELKEVCSEKGEKEKLLEEQEKQLKEKEKLLKKQLEDMERAKQEQEKLLKQQLEEQKKQLKQQQEEENAAVLVDKHREKIIDVVDNHMAKVIAEDLNEQGFITKEVMNKVKSSKTKRVSELFKALDSGGIKVKSAFYNILLKHYQHLSKLENMFTKKVKDQDAAVLVDRNREKIIDVVDNYMAKVIAEDLNEQGFFTEEMMNKVKSSKTKRMSELFKALDSGGIKVKSAFYNILLKHYQRQSKLDVKLFDKLSLGSGLESKNT